MKALVGIALGLLLSLGCGGDEEYAPCGELLCGDECQLCDPADPNCVETDDVKRCDTEGVCSASPVTCPIQ